jgi:hypothetical protein
MAVRPLAQWWPVRLIWWTTGSGDDVSEETTDEETVVDDASDDETASTEAAEQEDRTEDDAPDGDDDSYADEEEPEGLSRATLLIGAIVVVVVIGIVGVLIATSGGGDDGGPETAGTGGGQQGQQENVAVFGSTDSFDRAESADSLGNMPDGRAWLVDAGTWGITSGQAQVSESHEYRNHAVVGIGQGDGAVQVRMTRVTPGSGLVFRYEGPYNYWALVAVPEVATWNIYKVVDGTREIVGNTGEAQTRDGTTIAVRTNGDTIELIVNGRVMKTIVDDFGQDNGRFGLTVAGGEQSTTARFDDFVVGLPDGSPPPAAGGATPPGTGGGGGGTPSTAAP